MLSLPFLGPPLFHKPKPIHSTSRAKLYGSTGPRLHHISPQSVTPKPHQWEPAEEMEGKEQVLPAGLKREFMPQHIAVIMDGNRRWAKKNGWPSSVGHAAAYRTLRKLIGRCSTWGIRVLSVFAFSEENWNRSEMEVEFFTSLCERKIKAGVEILMRDNIRISFLRDASKLPGSLNKSMDNIEKATSNNTRIHVIVAISYSGKYDIMQACRNIAYKVKDGLIQPEEVNDNLIEHELGTNSTKIPNPDLLIRTSGELRVSNYLLWQLAYTELYFLQSLWPDFGGGRTHNGFTIISKKEQAVWWGTLIIEYTLKCNGYTGLS